MFFVTLLSKYYVVCLSSFLIILLQIYQAEHSVMTTSGKAARIPGWVHDRLYLTDNCSC